MPDVASPPLVPEGFNTDVYVVLEDFGQIGRAYRETDEERIAREISERASAKGEELRAQCRRSSEWEMERAQRRRALAASS